MSTLISAKPRRSSDSHATPVRTGRPTGRILSGPLALVFLAESCALTSFYLLLSVTPIYAAAAGAGSAGAGMVTSVLLLGTVAAELAAPVLMRRYGYWTMLVAGALLLGLPALALLPGGSLVVIVAVSAVRGLGFGLCTVMTGALTAVLLPPDRRGEGLGLFGVVATAPGIVALPGGVWLAGHTGVAAVVVMAAATALVPLAVFPWLSAPPASDNREAASAGAGRADGLLDGLRQAGQLRPFLIFAASTVAAGVVVSFLPLATGVSGNVAAAGLLVQALTATIRLASPAALIAGMSLFGIGFGIVQNATFALMIGRMPPSGLGTASALWNLAYDAGYGAGPAAFGLLVGHTGYPAAFALTAALMLAALPAAQRERFATASCSR